MVVIESVRVAETFDSSNRRYIESLHITNASKTKWIHFGNKILRHGELARLVRIRTHDKRDPLTGVLKKLGRIDNGWIEGEQNEEECQHLNVIPEALELVLGWKPLHRMWALDGRPVRGRSRPRTSPAI